MQAINKTNWQISVNILCKTINQTVKQACANIKRQRKRDALKQKTPFTLLLQATSRYRECIDANNMQNPQPIRVRLILHVEHNQLRSERVFIQPERNEAINASNRMDAAIANQRS